MLHISFYRCSVNVLMGDECCKTLWVAKQRLPKPAGAALLSQEPFLLESNTDSG